MQPRDIKLVETIFISLLVFLVTLSFLPSPGTSDLNIWKQWANNADTYGIVAGFGANHADYPPYSSVILVWAVRVSRLFGIGIFGAIKLSILLFLFFTSLIFWVWTRDFLTTVILHLSLLLNSVALGYIDIYFAPTLVLSMWAIKEQKLVLFTIFYALACLTKWQPLIVAPFIVLYILNIEEITQWKHIDFTRLSWNVVLPGIIIIILTLSIIGVTPLLMSLRNASNHEFLSGNALNFNWILTHFLHFFYPQSFGSLTEGQAEFILSRSLRITFVPKLLFLLSYIITVVSFFRRDKTFENLIIFSLIGYLAYFIFNTGVHENHLFLPTILSIILFWVNRDHLFLMIILILMSNINLLVFYGINGTGLGFSRILGETVDMALLLSILNVGFFLMLWRVNILRSNATNAAPQTSLS